MDRQSFPEELKQRRQWIAWKTVERRNKRGNIKFPKLPCDARTGSLAKTDDPSTWTSFDEACQAVERMGSKYQGVGFVFSEDDPFAFVDLDQCRNPETGVIAPWAASIVESLDSYTAVSQSGTGLHIIIEARLPVSGRRTGWQKVLDEPAFGKKKGDMGDKKPEIEIYDRRRFVALTGILLDPMP